MAKGKEKKKSSSKKSSGRIIGGGRWGIEIGDAGLSMLSGTVGKLLAPYLAKEWMPDFIKKGEVSDIGLYALGVAFRRRSLRSVGAGLVLSRSVATVI